MMPPFFKESMDLRDCKPTVADRLVSSSERVQIIEPMPIAESLELANFFCQLMTDCILEVKWHRNTDRLGRKYYVNVRFIPARLETDRDSTGKPSLSIVGWDLTQMRERAYRISDLKLETMRVVHPTVPRRREP